MHNKGKAAHEWGISGEEFRFNSEQTLCLWDANRGLIRVQRRATVNPGRMCAALPLKWELLIRMISLGGGGAGKEERGTLFKAHAA